MNSNNTNLYKRLLAVGLCGLGLWAGAAAADGGRYDRGAQLERRLDIRGDRIERRLDRRADELRAEGRYAEARRLERKGDRIDRRLDRRGEQLHRQWDREHRHGYAGHRHDHPHYRPVPVYVAPVPHRYVEPGLTLAIDLGRWIIRP
jgi:hypothetical protein